MRAIAQLLVRRRARSRSAGASRGLHGSAARRRDIGFARGAGLRSRLVSRARRSVPQMGPWPGPGMGLLLLRRGMEVGRRRPRMGWSYNGCPPGYWRGPWGHCRDTPYHGPLPNGGWQ